jgi:hypothetical protein
MRPRSSLWDDRTEQYRLSFTRVLLIEPVADPELVDGFVFTITGFVEMRF